MQRVKNIDYDEDDLYDDDDNYEEEEQAYTADDRANFASLTPVVRAELEEAGIEASNSQIQDALWHYYWDVGKSVAYLKTSKPTRVIPVEPKREKAMSKFDQAAQQNAQRAGNMRPAASLSGIVKKTDAIKLDSNSHSTQLKIRSKNLDVSKLWAAEKSKQKSFAAFVVIGHVDHGKSTLMGRLLLDTGAVSQRDIDKYKKQAAEIGKSSFALAWVMDTGSEERERGVTVDIAQHHFGTDNFDFTILDAPGHRDFVPNMIGGASMADLAVLVIDSNQLDSGMKGQTKEHILLAHAVGIRRVVVAVNKLDAATPTWDETLFMTVKTEVLQLLIDTGFAADDVAFVPCSGLSGENVVKPPSQDSNARWVSKASPTLLQQLEQCKPNMVTEDTVKAPLRLQIASIFRGGITNPLSISGRLESGSVQVGDVLVAQPSGERTSVKGIEVSGEARDWSVAGEISTLHLDNIEAQHLRVGDVVCGIKQPRPVTKNVIVKVHAVDSLMPQQVYVHFGRLHVSGAIRELLVIVNQEDEVVKKKPRIVKAGQSAIVRLGLENAVPVETGVRTVLRADGNTIAFGVIHELVDT